ncbi:MAG: PAS domain S-box protein [Rubrobacter sp.]|nr:PAS domain S-box protein [Rubrobacter sp.]
MRSVVRNASDMITVLETDGTIRYVSPAVERMLGYRPEELVGTLAFDYVHPEDTEFLSSSFAEGLENLEVPLSMEFRMRAADGSWRHVEMILNNRLDDPAVRGIVANTRDVTERKRAEERIGFQARLLDAVGQAVITTDSQGKVIYWNRAAERLYGWSEEEVMGRPILEVTPSEELLEQAEEIMSELVAGRSWSGEFVVGHKDGTSFPAMVTDTPVQDGQGNLVAIIGVSTDITELKKTEELRRSEERFRSLVQNASDVIIVTEADGTVRYISPAVKRLLGYRPEEVVGKDNFAVVHPDDMPRVQHFIAEAVRNPATTLSTELRLRHKDGSWRHIESSCTSLLDEPGVGGIVINSRDITEHKQFENALKESEERFRLLAENAQDVIFRYRLKPTPGFEYVSPSVTAMTGYTPKEHYADPEITEKVVHPDDGHILEQALRRPEEPIALRWLRKDGEIVWTDQRNKPIYDEAGELVAVEGIIRDITERKRAEEDLRKTQEFLMGILDNAPLPIYSVSEEGRMRSANRFFTDFIGMAQEKVIGSSLEDIFTEDEARQFREINQKVIETGTPLVEEEWAEAPDGRRYFQTIKFPLRDPDSRTDAIGGISIEFTARKRAENALRESEERFRSTFDEASIGMTVNELEGRFLQVNCALCEMLGYSEEELLATTFQAITHPDDLEADLDHVRRMLEGEADSFQMEKRYLHADGHVVWISLNASVVRDPEGYPLYFIGQIQDITERKAIEKEKARRARHAALRAEVNAALAKSGTMGSILQRCTKCMVRHLGVAFARIWTLNEEEDVLELRASAGMYTRLDGAYSRVPLGEYKIGLIAQERLPHLTNDVLHDPLISDREWAEREGMVAFAGHPLVVEDQLVGVMGMFALEPLEEDTSEALASVANVIAQGIKRKRADEALRSSEANLSDAQRIAHLGSWEWDLKMGEVWWSDEAYRIYGFEPNGFSPTLETVEEVFHPDDRYLFRAAIEDAFRKAESYDFEHRIVRPDGEVRWIQRRGEVVHGEGGESLRMIGTVHDMTERKALEERLHHQAFHDLLTGLPNRQLFVDRVEQSLRRTRRRQGQEVAVLFMDLDNFKVINDSLGHETGDRLLVAVAERLRGCLRPEDTLTRFGGDEFTVLVEEVEGASDAVRVAKRIVECFQQPFVLDGREFAVTTSIGIALGDARTKRPEELLRDADAAMYQAKEEGNLKYEVFEPSMHERALERLQIENDLRRALENEEFRVHYQPIINLQTGEVWGVEALVRWEHPKQGLLNPGQFVPLAEETGLIVSIGGRVLKEACEQAKEWQEDRHSRIPPLVTCVNFSARQLQHPDCIQTVEEMLQETGLEAGSLCLDITETVYIRATADQNMHLDRLKALGVRISIDDFGTGYSSLSYLRRLPADDLKLDKSFVDGIGENAKDAAIAQTVIDLAHTLGMSVIAEGVESADQAAQLKEMGCELAQGYYFAKPLPPQAASEFLAR